MTPTLLLILDGWGLAENGPYNATYQAKTPNLDKLYKTCKHSKLIASGRDVGLPTGYMGNSEVGHLNIGAGRIVYQDMTRIDVSLEDNSFQKNIELNKIISKTKKNNSVLHLLGLLSDGGVHSHINHLLAICDIANQNNITTRIHCILDGRDTPPTSGIDYLKKLEEHIKNLPNVEIATVIGRFYAMDRDKRWDRVEQAWKLFCDNIGEKSNNLSESLKKSYEKNITDEFVKPIVHNVKNNSIKDNDTLLLFNFRADRMREITSAFLYEDFKDFKKSWHPKLAHIVSMTPYDATFDMPVLFPKESIHMGLGEYLSNQNIHQLRLAETEKYAHVTYFFNGGIEEPFKNEDRLLIPSPRDVATYDLKPAMSAREVTEKFVNNFENGNYDFVVVNLANGDMVGHTGILSAAIEACSVVDECIGKIMEAIKNKNGCMLIIADHGNCEIMQSDTGQAHTSHTTNPVPCILFDSTNRNINLKDGRLCDVAPTILELMGITKPKEMTGQSLCIKEH